MCHLLLGQVVEEVCLVFFGVHALFQQPAAVLLDDLTVVTGGHVVHLDLPGTDHQLSELHIPVAVDAGVGGQPVQVAVRKGLHDGTAEVLCEVEHIVLQAQPVADGFGVVHVPEGAAGGLHPRPNIFVVEQAHGAAHHVISLLLQQAGGHGAVYPAAHAAQYFSLHVMLPSFASSPLEVFSSRSRKPLHEPVLPPARYRGVVVIPERSCPAWPWHGWP